MNCPYNLIRRRLKLQNPFFTLQNTTCCYEDLISYNGNIQLVNVVPLLRWYHLHFIGVECEYEPIGLIVYGWLCNSPVAHVIQYTVSHPEGPVDVELEVGFHGRLWTGRFLTEIQLRRHMHLHRANTILRACIHLHYFSEIHLRHCRMNISIQAYLDAHEVGDLCDILKYEGEFEVALPLNSTIA